MRHQQIRRWRERKPFRRFEVELTSGSRLRVTHPENIFVAPEVCFVRMPDERSAMFFPEEVAALHLLAIRKRNGRRSSR